MDRRRDAVSWDQRGRADIRRSHDQPLLHHHLASDGMGTARSTSVASITARSNGPADRAGVQPGDAVLTIDSDSFAAITA